MSSEQLHAPRERLTGETVALHQAIASLIEELEAIDWYRQRADDCEDRALKAILLHNMREEMEHASMVLEWIRRNSPDFARQLKTYLFSFGDIAGREEIDRVKDETPRTVAELERALADVRRRLGESQPEDEREGDNLAEDG